MACRLAVAVSCGCICIISTLSVSEVYMKLTLTLNSFNSFNMSGDAFVVLFLAVHL